MTQKFIVSVPGRAQPLCIEADAYKLGGLDRDGVTFFKGGVEVALVPAVDLVAKDDCLPEFPALSQFAPPIPACVDLLPGMAFERIAEPVRGLDPVAANSYVTHNHWGARPIWPLLAGFAVGALSGVLGMLGYAFV